MSAAEVITVVSGLPRSGTSLMMQMLEAGGLPPLCDAGRAPDAHNPRGYYELERTKALGRDASWLGEAKDRAIKVVAPLLRYLPTAHRYRVVFLERSMAEVLASQAEMLASPLGSAQGVDRDADAVLARAFARQVDEAQRLLAERGVPLLRVAHRELIASPRRQAERIAAFVLRPLDVEAMAACVDPDLYRRRSNPATPEVP